MNDVDELARGVYTRLVTQGPAQPNRAGFEQIAKAAARVSFQLAEAFLRVEQQRAEQAMNDWVACLP
jgi:hypothetical protein